MNVQIDKYGINPSVLYVGTEGSVGIEVIEPTFSADWAELLIKVVFQPARGKSVEVSYNGKPIPVPPEVMRYSGRAYCIFSGYRILSGGGLQRIKTVQCTLNVMHTLGNRGSNSIPETPDMYEQLRSDLKDDIENALTEAKESGEFDGPVGPIGPAGPIGPIGDSGVYILQEGETIDDAPEDADVVVDPFNPKKLELVERYIEVIERTAGTGAPGKTDTYTIYYSDGSTFQYQVYNGADGRGFVILGYYDTYEQLAEAVPNPSAGMAYGIGTEAPYTVYVYDGVGKAWKNNGPISGIAGADGKSAEMQVTDTHIQWRLEGEEWQNLIALSLLQGQQGNGIVSIARTAGDGSAGTVDTYTITYTNGETDTYTVTNGNEVTVDDTVTENGGNPVSSAGIALYVKTEIETAIGEFLTGAS